jgi:hypothetical protein
VSYIEGKRAVDKLSAEELAGSEDLAARIDDTVTADGDEEDEEYDDADPQ